MDATGGINNAPPISLDPIQTYIQTHVSNLTDMLNEQYAKLADERKKIEREKEDFNAAHKIVASFKDPIKLNVGGTIFMTSKSTILKHESMLSAMFSGRHTLEKGEDGAYFIDRDPKHFGRILNFLRDGEFEVPKEEIEMKEILREADYYSMTALLEYLSEFVSGHRSEHILPLFDPSRKGAGVIIEGAKASYQNDSWRSAFTLLTFSKGVHKCTFTWTGVVLIGVTGANIDHSKSAFDQKQSMMLYSGGALHCAGKSLKKLPPNEHNLGTVEVDCDNKTVTWIYGTNRFTEPMHPNLKAPFSFCVELYKSSATITAIE